MVRAYAEAEYKQVSAALAAWVHDYGEVITVTDADGRDYEQTLCICGAGLGVHLSLEEHRRLAIK